MEQGLLAVLLNNQGRYYFWDGRLPGRQALTCFIGMNGWRLPLDRPVIDPLALAEPFLARLPSATGRISGHYERALPPGYLASRRDGNNQLWAPELGQLYDDVNLVTRSPNLFSGERLAAIWRLNTGHYRQLDQHFDRNHTEFAGTGIKLAPIPPDFMQPGTVCTPEPIPLF